MVWLHNRKGEYTVQSGYHVACQVLRNEVWVEASNRSGWQHVWGNFVEVKDTRENKIFSWRASYDILPTRVNLAKRKVISDSLCHCCKRLLEDALHAIWGCGVVRDVWAGSLHVMQRFQTNHFDFLQLFTTLLDRLSTTELELFLVQAWLIWNQRNVVVHGGQMKNSQWLTTHMAKLLEEYQKAHSNLRLSSAATGSNYQKPLPQDVYKLNFDAVVFLDLNCSRVGVII